MMSALVAVESYIRIAMEGDLIDRLNKKTHKDDWRSCPKCGYKNHFSDDTFTNYCAKCGTPLHEKDVFDGTDILMGKLEVRTVKEPIDYIVVEKDEYWKLKTENADLSLKINKLSTAIKEQRKKNSGKLFGNSSMNTFLSELESILRVN